MTDIIEVAAAVGRCKSSTRRPLDLSSTRTCAFWDVALVEGDCPMVVVASATIWWMISPETGAAEVRGDAGAGGAAVVGEEEATVVGWPLPAASNPAW